MKLPFLMIGLAVQAQAQSLEAVSNQIRLSYETLPVTESETMGFVGAHYDHWLHPNVFWGIGGFGALVGDRGGLFTLGLNLGVQHPILQGFIEAGAFVGGGGGASAFPGHGLMTRPYVALGYQLDGWQTRLEYSRIDFPGAYEGHQQWAFGVAMPVTDWLLSNQLADTQAIPSTQALRISPMALVYLPSDEQGRRSGKPINPYVGLAGIQIDRFVHPYAFVGFEGYGAGLGGAGGYAKLLANAGLSYPLTDAIHGEAKLALGMSGGGDLDSGGGLIVQPMLGLSLQFSEHLSWIGRVGRTWAPTGSLNTQTLATGLGWKIDQWQRAVPEQYQRWDWQLQLSNKTYQPLEDVQYQYSGRPMDQALQLFGVAMKQPILGPLYGKGATHWAWWGDIGAYAEGWFGLGLETPGPWSALIEAELGVSGGGGMDVRSGLLFAVATGMQYSTDELGAFVTLGYTQAQEGSFAGYELEAGLSFPISIAYQ